MEKAGNRPELLLQFNGVDVAVVPSMSCRGLGDSNPWVAGAVTVGVGVGLTTGSIVALGVTEGLGLSGDDTGSADSVGAALGVFSDPAESFLPVITSKRDWQDWAAQTKSTNFRFMRNAKIS